MSREFLPNTLPEVKEWIEHEESHGKVFYSSDEGLYCSKLNCVINKNPRSVQPLYDYFDRRSSNLQ